MDPEFALLLLESELLNRTKIEPEELGQFGEAVATAARTPEGYSGLAWTGGARLMGFARGLGQDPEHLFVTFGWRALANGIRAGLEDKRLLTALSYANVPFLPSTESPPIFDHPQIVEAIRSGLAATPRPFIKPSDLGAADTAVQAQFGELLNRLPSFSADDELILQWASSALRVLPIQSRPHQVAAINLLLVLCRQGRLAAAYYTLRALAEQHEDLWKHAIVPVVLQSFIDRYWQDEEVGSEVLVQLCVDEDVLRRCNEQFDMLVLVGALAVNLSRRYGDKQTEATAWHFVNEMFGVSALVTYTFGKYLTDGVLPPLPISRVERLETLQQEFDQAIALADNELRPRLYGQVSLAGKIYQSNVQQVFGPLLDKIRSGQCPSSLVERIQEIDAGRLITQSELQQSSRHPIDGRMLRKMIGDNSRILQALESAAWKRIELEKARAEWADHHNDEFELYREFELLLGNLDTAATWALETLLPDLWMRIQQGITIVAREQEVRQHGT